jgi:hypothetical protein
LISEAETKTATSLSPHPIYNLIGHQCLHILLISF